jgi:hypothetical protein
MGESLWASIKAKSLQGFGTICHRITAPKWVFLESFHESSRSKAVTE